MLIALATSPTRERSMSTIEVENTERVTKVFEAFGRGDVKYILDQLAEDVRFVSHLDPSVPWAGEYSGKDAVAQYFQALGGAVDVSDHPVEAVVAQGDTVVAMGEVSFRVRDTGKTGSSSWVYIWTLANGEIQSYEQFNDTGLADAFR
jgi:ketosteroid isomerase-like protein